MSLSVQQPRLLQSVADQAHEHVRVQQLDL